MRLKDPEVHHPQHVQFSRSLNAVPLGYGLKSADEIRDELMDMVNTVLRGDAPVNSPYLDLMEVATAYYSRGLELDMLIHEGERDQVILKGSDLYKLRTGALRSFIDLMKRQAELGSRRLTQEALLVQQRLDAGA